MREDSKPKAIVIKAWINIQAFHRSIKKRKKNQRKWQDKNLSSFDPLSLMQYL